MKLRQKLLGFALSMWMAFTLITVIPSNLLSQPSDEVLPPSTTITSPSAPVDSPALPVADVPDIVGEETAAEDGEEALNPEEVLGLIQSLITLLQGKNWLGASIIIILLLTSLLKTPLAGEFLGKVIPKRYIILIPLGLGVIAGGIQAVIEGGWQNGIVTALTSGGFAVFSHEFLDRIVKNKDGI